MKLVEHLFENRGEIECEQCGHCCPNYCKPKSGNTCKNHPNNPKAISHIRGVNCGRDPIFFAFSMGVACSAVLNIIRGLTHQDVDVIVDKNNGVTFIANASLYGPDTFDPNNMFYKILDEEIAVKNC